MYLNRHVFVMFIIKADFSKNKYISMSVFQDFHVIVMPDLGMCKAALVSVYSLIRLLNTDSDTSTLQPLYNTVHYNTVLDITRFKDGSQKCIDYIEK